MRKSGVNVASNRLDAATVVPLRALLMSRDIIYAGEFKRRFLGKYMISLRLRLLYICDVNSFCTFFGQLCIFYLTFWEKYGIMYLYIVR